MTDWKTEKGYNTADLPFQTVCMYVCVYNLKHILLIKAVYQYVQFYSSYMKTWD